MFRAVAKDIDDHGADAFLSLGDWIYADALGGLWPAKSFSEYADRYGLVNGTKGAQALFEQNIPIYQMRDDHEFWNGSDGAPSKSKKKRAAHAQRAYNLFQRPQGGDTEHPWSTLSGNIDGFVMDLRSELLPSKKQAISPEQMLALKKWLKDPAHKNRVKPIFMSTTALMFRGDAWSVSPEQLSELLNFIQEEKLKYVAFFTGDIHVGKTGLYRFETDKDDKKEEENGLHILEVASSAFHKISTSKDGLLSNECDLSQEGGPKLSAEGRFSETVMEDHFTRISIDHKAHKVEVLKKGRKGEVFFHATFNLETGEYKTVKESDPIYKMLTEEQL